MKLTCCLASIWFNATVCCSRVAASCTYTVGRLMSESATFLKQNIHYYHLSTQAELLNTDIQKHTHTYTSLLTLQTQTHIQTHIHSHTHFHITHTTLLRLIRVLIRRE